MRTNYSSKHLKTLLYTLFFICVFSITKANTYYSTGSLSVSSLLSWKDALGNSPTGFNFTDTFIIKSTHSMFVGSNWKITGNNVCIIIGTGGSLLANDSINLKNNSTFIIKDGGTYIHKNTSYAPTSIFRGTEIFEPNSTVEIADWYSYKVPITVGTFGNLKITYNPADIWNQDNNINTINGDFILNNRSKFAFQFASNSNLTVTINKNFIIYSGVFNFAGGFSNTYILNIKGGLIQTGGTISHFDVSGSLGVFTINFTGDSSYIYKTSGTYRALKINYSVENNAKFYITKKMQIRMGRSFNVYGTLICDSFSLFGSGSFILQPNAFIYIGSDSGICRTGIRKGNIQTLFRTFSNNANYIYNGKNNQSSGNGIPNQVKTLTINLLNSNKILALKKSISISENLHLKNGIVKTDTSKIILGISNTNIGTLVYTNGFIDGNFGRYFGNTTNSNISGLMPVGANNIYRPLIIEFTTAPNLGGLILSKFIETPPGNSGLILTENGLDINSSSIGGYWKNEIFNGDFSSGEYTMTINPNSFPDIIDPNSLHIISRNTNGNWTLNGDYLPSYGNITNPVVSRINMTRINEIGVGISSKNLTLPVAWNQFEVSSQDEDILLDWSTNLEINNDYFEIEKSTDAINFYKIGKVDGAGNSSELSKYEFIDVNAKNTTSKTIYYRIKQVDYDKKYDYSIVKYIDIQKTNKIEDIKINVYPNPSSDVIKVESQKNIKMISIHTIDGKLMYSSTIENSNVFETNISEYPNNVYILTLHFNDMESRSKRIIKN